MPGRHARQERRTTPRVAVDAVLLYRAAGMDDFRACRVLSLSSKAVEIVSERSIPVQTTVVFALTPDPRPGATHQLQGRVEKREHREAGWAHIVSMSSQPPGSVAMLHEILSPARGYRYQSQTSYRQPGSPGSAMRAVTIQPPRPITALF